MKNIVTRLHELETLELEHYKKRKRTLAQRAQEDDIWQEKLNEIDNEARDLRLRRRELATAFSNPPLAPKNRAIPPPATSPAPPTAARKASPRGSPRPGPKAPDPLFRSDKAEFPIARDSSKTPVFCRPSDGKLMYLECCVARCNTRDFTSVTALKSHAANRRIRTHKRERRLVGRQDVFRLCGRLVPETEIGLLNWELGMDLI